LLITRALSPAKVSSIKINEETKRAEVFFEIRGSFSYWSWRTHIKLAGLLTGYGTYQEDVAGATADEMMLS
jgi:N utilization substance protein A